MRKINFLFAFLLSVMGVTQAWAQKALPYSYGFEDNNLATDGWATVNPSGLNNSEFAINTDAKKSGSYGFCFSSYSDRGESTQYLISPELNAPNGVIVSFAYKASSSNTGGEKFKVGYSTTDAEISSFTWGDEISYSSTTWAGCENTFPAGTKYVAVYYYANYQYHLYVDDFQFDPVIVGPGFAVEGYANGSSFDFGLVGEGATKTFNLLNPGTESVTVGIAATGGFSVSPASVTIAAKGSETITVTVPNVSGNGTVIFTPTASDLSAVTINLTAELRDPNKYYVDFADGLPEGWVKGSWTIYTSGSASPNGNSGYAEASNSRTQLTTPVLLFAEGETITFLASRNSKGNQYPSYGVDVQYMNDNQEWITAKSISWSELEQGEWTTYSVAIPAGKHRIAFKGSYVYICDIYGGVLNKEPFMEVSAADYEFGWVATAASTTFTINNTGLAELTNIAVTSDNEGITANVPVSIAAGASATVTLNMAPGFYNNDVIVSAPEQTSVSFHVLGAVKKDGKILVDFEGGIAPEGWTTEGWTINSSPSGTDNNKGWAGPTDTDVEVRLISPKLTVEEGEPLFFSVFPRYDDSGSLKIEYRDNETDEWTVAKSFKYSDFASGKWSMISVTEIPAGTHYIAFNDQEIYLTDIYGFQLAQDEPATGMNIYMKANGWAADNARMLAWYWGEGNEGAWSDNLTAVEGEEDIYTVSLPEGTTGLKFVRKSQDSALGWGSENNWNESANNINVYDGAYYTMTGFSGFNGNDPIYGYYEQELTEAAENTDAIHVGTHHKMTVAFTMQAGKFAAICLPFATTTTALGEGVKAWAFTGYTDGNIDLSTTTELAAATPYIVYAENGIDGLTFQNVTIESNEAGKVEQGAATFQGSYVKMAAGTMTDKYGVTPAGKIQKAGSGASMKAFRAYFEGITQGAKLVCDGEIIGEATGIDTIENAAQAGELYDLQGRCVMNAQKGLYIQNGKKVVMK